MKLLLSMWSSVSILATGVYAQDAPPAEPGAEAPPPAAMTAQEAIAAAGAAFDKLDAAPTDAVRQEALSEIRTAVEALQAAEPTNPWLLYFSGRINAVTGRQLDAIKQLQEFTDKTREGRTEWRAYRVLGELFADGYPRQAEMYFNRALQIHPDEPSVLLGLAACAQRIGDPKKAIDYARRVVAATGRQNIQHMESLAKLLIQDKQLAEAVDVARETLELARARYDAARDRTALAVLERQYRNVIEAVQGQINAEPGVLDRYRAFARLLREHADVSSRLRMYDALDVVRMGIGQGQPPDTVGLMEDEAAILKYLNRPEEAEQVYRNILDVDPNNAAAIEALNTSPAPAP